MLAILYICNGAIDCGIEWNGGIFYCFESECWTGKSVFPNVLSISLYYFDSCVVAMTLAVVVRIDILSNNSICARGIVLC
jgi:hypothetical protein